MSTALWTVAALVALLLLAAFGAPYFIDWSFLKERIEAQASQTLGQSVSVDGPIDVRLLPTPRLLLEDVSVAHGGEPAGEMARMARLDVALALPPLLSGNIAVSELSLAKPVINLTRYADGSCNWQDLNLDADAAGGPFSLRDLRLDSARMAGGTISYRDEIAGETYLLEKVDGTLTAETLLGPGKSDVSFVYRGVSARMTLNLGSFGTEKAVPVTADLALPGNGVSAKFVGLATSSSPPRLDGEIRVDVKRLGSEAAAKRKGLSLSAALVADGRSATLRKVVVDYANTRLEGDGTVTFASETARLQLALSGERWELDPLMPHLTRGASQDDLPFAELLGLRVPSWLDLALDVRAGLAVLAGQEGRNAVLVTGGTPGKLVLKQAGIELPGESEIALNGTLATGALDGRFDGEIIFSTKDMAALFEGPAAQRSAGTPDNAPVHVSQLPDLQPLKLEAKLAVSPALLQLYNVRTVAGGPAGTSMRGGFSYASHNGAPVLAAEVRADRLDLTPLGLASARWFDTAGGRISNASLSLNLTARELVYDTWRAEGVAARGSYDKGTLSVDTLEIADFAGAAVTLSGKANKLDARKGVAAHSNLVARLETASAGELLGALGAGSGFVSALAKTPLKLDATYSTDDLADGTGTEEKLLVEGSLASSRLDLVARRVAEGEGEARQARLAANLVNESAAELLSQLNFQPAKDLSGSARVSLNLQERAQGGFDVDARMAAGSAQADFEGLWDGSFTAPVVDGRLNTSSAGAFPWLQNSGFPKPVLNLLAAQSQGLGYVYSSRLAFSPGRIETTDLNAATGDFRMTGAYTVELVREGTSGLSGNLKATKLDLTSLVAGPDGSWARVPLDWGGLADVEGSLALSLDEVQAGPLFVADAEATVRLDGGQMTVTLASASMARGGLSGKATFETEAGVPQVAVVATLTGAEAPAFAKLLLPATPVDGRMDLTLETTGAGMSVADLAGAATGEGSLQLGEARLEGVNLAAFNEGLAAAASSEEETIALAERTLSTGTTRLGAVTLPASVASGVVSVTLADTGLANGTAKGDGRYDLLSGTATAHLVLMPAAMPDAPPLRIDVERQGGSVVRTVEAGPFAVYARGRVLDSQLQEALGGN